MLRIVWAAGMAALVAACPSAGSSDGLQPKPIPRVQAVPLPYDQVSFQRDGREIARYHFGPGLIRPFVYPIIGPSGHGLTRMGHPGDPDTHSHHNSVWLSLSDVNGVDFWLDRGGGRIRHRRIEHLEDADDFALVVSEADWVDGNGDVVMRERRQTFAKLLPREEWMLVIDIRLDAADEAAVIEPSSFGPIGVRLAKPISVHYGGGRIRNSEGFEGETAVFRKPARWVDYSGQSATGIIEGLTLMDHPSNPRHPAPFHVREDGWMGAMLALHDPYTIQPGKPLRMRYAVYVHAGMPPLAHIDKAWRRFATEPLRPPFGPPKTARDCLHGGYRRYNMPRSFSSQQDCANFVKGAQ
ncbi:MAG: hypothetical protein GEU99_14045 [Luteitalea sp.]|nr:hypothetical protein [Luteitalea sp.]